MRLENKVAIITGSARGIGQALALRFAKEGAKVTVCDILDCTPVAAEIEKHGGQALPLKTDITLEKDTLEMARQTIYRFGRIDILVNNAAIAGGPDFHKLAEKLTSEDWDKLLGVNVKGTFLVSKAVIPFMKQQQQGCIINISSTTAFTGGLSVLHYSTSKGGIISMTKGLAVELSEFNIRVNAVAPGPVRSGVVTEEMKIRMISSQLLKRIVRPEDVANAVLFLASDEADLITGQTLAVNAGEFLH